MINHFSGVEVTFPGQQLPSPIQFWARHHLFIAKIDLSEGFHTIPLAEDQQQFYCFKYQGQIYSYRRMPMSASGAPRHFLGVMNNPFQSLYSLFSRRYICQ
eukprot:Blabericola_migrator_1__4933@NODE_2572_length_2587_cov_150_202778_g1610_i0_p3_GENE_NODE_2572_length_2587_cov_150_202778_g1610_i0NODE_2572_length_2587_cov_150_202778_g1610_i0_p3_ORF_typecomplete_len101_score10_04RVT_1/PF00078_27/0_0079_NODE_2572_length_2587_cov_150_202778_g1610_i0672974